MTTNVPTPAGRDLQVAVPLRQERLPDVEELFRPLPPLNVTRMFANTGDMAEAVLGFVRAVFTAEGVDPRLREILTLRTAWILRVPYEWEANVPMARNVGVTDADIASIATDGPVTGLDATANLICRATDEITHDVAVSDVTLQEMLDVFGLPSRPSWHDAVRSPTTPVIHPPRKRQPTMTDNGLAERCPVAAGNPGAPRGAPSNPPHARIATVVADLDDHEPKEPVVGSDSNRTMTLVRVANVGDEASWCDSIFEAAAPGGVSAQALTAELARSDRAADPPRQRALPSFADPLDEHGRPPRLKIIIPESLDLSNAPALLRTLRLAIDRTPGGIEVDMSGADFVGVAGWRVLLRSAGYAAGRAPFTLSGLSARHRRTADLLGLTEALHRLSPRDRPGLPERPPDPAPTRSTQP